MEPVDRIAFVATALSVLVLVAGGLGTLGVLLWVLWQLSPLLPIGLGLIAVIAWFAAPWVDRRWPL